MAGKGLVVDGAGEQRPGGGVISVWRRDRWRRSLRAELAERDREVRTLRRELEAVKARAARQQAAAAAAAQVARAREEARGVIAEAGGVRFNLLQVRGLLVDLPMDDRGRLDVAAFAVRVFDAAAEVRDSEESAR